jgi:hypothetical protein
MYYKYVGVRGPEARLYAACVAAFLFPAGGTFRTAVPSFEVDVAQDASFMLGLSNQGLHGSLLSWVWWCVS